MADLYTTWVMENKAPSVNNFELKVKSSGKLLKQFRKEDDRSIDPLGAPSLT